MALPKKQLKSNERSHRYTVSFQIDVEKWIKESALNMGISPIDFIRIKIMQAFNDKD